MRCLTKYQKTVSITIVNLNNKIVHAPEEKDFDYNILRRFFSKNVDFCSNFCAITIIFSFFTVINFYFKQDWIGLFAICFPIVFLIIFNIFMTTYKGGTVEQLLCRLKIFTKNGNRLPPVEIFFESSF